MPSMEHDYLRHVMPFLYHHHSPLSPPPPPLAPGHFSCLLTPIIARFAPPFSSSPKARCGVHVIRALVVAVASVDTAYGPSSARRSFQVCLLGLLQIHIQSLDHRRFCFLPVAPAYLSRPISCLVPAFFVSCFLFLSRRLGLVRVRCVRVVWASLGSDRIVVG